MKGCFKFFVSLFVLIIGASFVWYFFLLTPEQRQTAREDRELRAKIEEHQEVTAKAETAKQEEADHQLKQRQNEELGKRQEKAGEMQQAYLEELVAIEGVERAEFVNLTHLKLRLKPLVHIGTEHVRVMCENVAKGWAARSGLTPVYCEEWYGEKIYAKGEYTGPVPEAYLLKVMSEVMQKQQAKDSAALVAMQGKTFAEIEGTHGAAITKSKETGWAEFRTFRARFENGKVAEVSVK